MRLSCLFVVCLSLCFSQCKEPAGQNDNTSWPVTGGAKDNNKYSALTQIDTTNVEQLQVAWTYHSEQGDSTRFGVMETNPIIIDSVLYGVSPKMKLFAIHAGTGKEIWHFDPADSAQNPTWHLPNVNMNRGVTWWSDGTDHRIIFCVGTLVFAVNADNGRLVKSFGREGAIDLRFGLDRDNPLSLYMVSTSPVMVYQDHFIVSGLAGENTPGHIRAFNVRTGKQDWIFHTIPLPGEPGYETWEDTTAYKRMGSTNAWPGFSLDEKRGIVYAVTGNPTNDFYGGSRLGDNLYANCIIALDANTGKRIWHFQTVHHDVWDRDLPAPPVLATIDHDGKKVDVAIQTSKQGMIFVFNRETGEPVFPIAEMPFPTNTQLTREKLSPTQPVPQWPEPFARQKMTIDDLNTLVSDSSYADLKKRFLGYSSGTPFTPPTEKGTIVFPGYDGGGEWGGASFDPVTQYLFVNGNEMPWVLNMVPAKIEKPKAQSFMEAGENLYSTNCRGCHGPDLKGGGDYPSILNVNQKLTETQFVDFISTGRRMMPGFAHLDADQKKALATYVLKLKTAEKKPYPKTETGDNMEPADLYGFTGYNKFLSLEGYPGVKPPWGTLNAIDMKTGKYVWKVPLGEFAELAAKGIPTTGRENYGGAVVTAGNLLFIAATADSKFRAFNKLSGKLLWETTLPATGVATPAIYSLNGRQYVVIACGGSKWFGGSSSDTYLAYALPEK